MLGLPTSSAMVGNPEPCTLSGKKSEIWTKLGGSKAGAGVGWWDRGGGLRTSRPNLVTRGCNSAQALSVRGPRCWVDVVQTPWARGQSPGTAWWLCSTAAQRGLGSVRGSELVGLSLGMQDCMWEPWSRSASARVLQEDTDRGVLQPPFAALLVPGAGSAAEPSAIINLGLPLG